MGHSHPHHPHRAPQGEAGKNLATAFAMNFAFSIIELIGGLMTNSMAILSDALHDFGDSVSLGLAWYFQKLSSKKPDARFTYGYKRFSPFGALINALILLIGSVIVLYESIGRLFQPEESNAKGMIFLALLGLLANGLAMLRLKRGKSLNERIVYLHFLEDILGWIAVLIGSILMIFFRIPILDPILSIGISIFMLFNVSGNLKVVFKVFLQAKPDHVDSESMRSTLKSLNGVVDVHDWHVWTMDNEFLVATVHLIVSEDCTKQEQQTLRSAAHAVLQKKGVQHATIEIESISENCTWCDAY
jgi:cobalt-zinc-cadmium efflux system protein